MAESAKVQHSGLLARPALVSVIFTLVVLSVFLGALYNQATSHHGGSHGAAPHGSAAPAAGAGSAAPAAAKPAAH